MFHVDHTERTRTAAALVGAVAWASLAALLYLSMQDAGGGVGGVLAGVVDLLYYFTVLTNLGVALATTVPLVAPESVVGRFLRRAGTQTGIAASIAYVGAVYHLLLRRPWESPSLAVLADAGVHYATPALFVAFWWYAVPKGSLEWRDVGWWCGYPAAYFVYVLLRGAASGDYPYPFLDAEALGYAGVFAFGLGLLVAFAATSLLFVAAGRFEARRSGEM
ncbi:Pr6Pr family membrane protein [Natronomonas salina]|uniref:Pr6Pr family membrane protein n=1 Tax=Natronomonas salina TaxID=1710540 RepID=UPI0015B66D73|nr:Pr6Pr family membrane protein [Natronomonas salina]QLD90873.1 Pr6Pr family membrane protein [Natronomonas salina]